MKNTSIQFICAAVILLQFIHPAECADGPEMAVIRPDMQTGFVNAGWKLDRYADLPSLDAKKTMPVADLKGPGIIRHLHFTRHDPN